MCSSNPSIWNEIPDITVDYLNFEYFFAIKDHEGSYLPRKSEGKPKSSRARIIDDKRSRQFAIMLGRFPSLEILKEAIENCDFTVLNPERVSMRCEMVIYDLKNLF